MERTSFIKLSRCWRRDLVFSYFYYKVFLPEEAIVIHLIICQGRYHLVNTQFGRHNLVIVNVHFEPELTLRQLRGRLHLIHPHWPP